MLANRRYCYPLTITDFASRYLLTCEALSTTQEIVRLHRLRAHFQGIRPAARRSAPTTACRSRRPTRSTGSASCRCGGSGSAFSIERIKPGHPEQNGRHERMHLTLKQEATKPAAANVLQQQARFDAFVQRYNHERPHQALAMKVPADLYARHRAGRHPERAS